MPLELKRAALIAPRNTIYCPQYLKSVSSIGIFFDFKATTFDCKKKTNTMVDMIYRQPFGKLHSSSTAETAVVASADASETFRNDSHKGAVDTLSTCQEYQTSPEVMKHHEKS